MVLATVQQDGAPVSGVVVEFSRSVAGRAAEYEWSETTDAEGQARIEITSDSGYYQARALQDGSEIGALVEHSAECRLRGHARLAHWRAGTHHVF